MTIDLSKFPKVSLGHLPTPIERLDRLSEHLGGPEIWIKRDDCTGLAFGGNKTRKLEFLLGDARSKGSTDIVTFGAVQSNHVRQTIAACAKTGFTCHAILTDIVPHKEAAYRQSGNLLLDRMSTAHIHILPSADAASAKLKEINASLGNGKSAYVIPPGGSSPMGVLGYVAAAVEIGQQAKDLDLTFDAILSASATGGTHVGLTLGSRQGARSSSVYGANIYHTDPATFEERIEKLADEVCESFGVSEFPQLQHVHGFVGDGYGLPTPEMKEAVLTTFQLEGILLDPVYTGKGMAALFDMCRKRAFTDKDKILFVHTGGAPGLFAYQEAMS